MPGFQPQPSFVALVSDIHGNIDALSAVLADIGQWSCREIFCLGDVVGYGPEPAACVEKIRNSCALTVMGNHEAMLLMAIQNPLEDVRDTVAAPIELAVRQLGEAQMDWIRGLPLSADLGPISLAHAALHEPGEFPYIDSTEEAERHFAIQSSFVSFHGHTHIPVIWEEGEDGVVGFMPSEKPVLLEARKRYAVNVGSVGQARDGDPRACYVLYDPRKRILLHRRVEYDLAKAVKRFQKAGMPRNNSKRLKRGE